MTHSHNSISNPLGSVVKWTARLAGVVSFGILALFVVSHVGAGEMKPDIYEAVGLACFPFGVMLGLALAFRFDMVGAVTAIISCAGFYVWHFTRSGDLPSGIFFLLFTSPAILYLISGWLRRAESRLSNHSSPNAE